jgi:hypothetical protein
MQVGQTRRRVDVDMTAHHDGAERSGLADQRIGALDDRRGTGQFLLFDSETLTQTRDMTMRTPAVAHEAFIEVNMSIDEPGQHQVPCQIDHLRAVDLRTFRTDADKAPLMDSEAERAAVGVYGIDEYAVEHGSAYASQDSSNAP